MRRIRCTFIPQVWERDSAVTIEFENVDSTWEMEVASHLLDGLADRVPPPYSDWLRDSESAPLWVQHWPGPFEIEVESVEEEEVMTCCLERLIAEQAHYERRAQRLDLLIKRKRPLEVAGSTLWYRRDYARGIAQGLGAAIDICKGH